MSRILDNARGTILLVEDHADLREAMTSLLEAFGYEVVTAADGGEALDRLRRGIAPCLIVLDLEMPRKDGWKFRSEQLHDPKLAGIPTIVSSAEANVKEKAALLGIHGYFEKRGGFDGLLDLVARYSSPSGGGPIPAQGGVSIASPPVRGKPSRR